MSANVCLNLQNSISNLAIFNAILKQEAQGPLSLPEVMPYLMQKLQLH